VQQHAAHYNPFIISMFISTFGQDEGPIKLPASGVILTGAGAHKKRQGEKRIFLAFSRKKFAGVSRLKFVI